PSRSSHSSLGRPPRSQSVRASSRRWSKKRMLSFSCSIGLTTFSMKSSSSTRYAAISGGMSKFMAYVLSFDGERVDRRADRVGELDGWRREEELPHAIGLAVV